MLERDIFRNETHEYKKALLERDKLIFRINIYILPDNSVFNKKLFQNNWVKLNWNLKTFNSDLKYPNSLNDFVPRGAILMQKQ